MREMKDSNVNWLNAIPCEWALSRIKYVLNERIEKNDPIKTKDILSLTAKQGVIPLSKKQGGGNKPKEDFTAYKLAYPNDIVVNSMNILSGSVGLSKYFGCVSPVYYMLRPFNDNFDVRYFNYIFQTKVFQLSLFGLGNGILIKESGNGKFNTIRMRIPMEKFGNLLIPVPNKKEQQQIADYLDTQCSEIDATSEDIQKEISLLEEYKKSVITEAVTKGLNPDAEMKDSKIFYLGKINKTWNLTKVGYCCKKLYRPFEPSDEALVCSNKGKVVPRGDTLIGLMTSDDNAMQGICKGDIAIHGMDTWHGAIACSDYDGKITRVVHVCKADGDNRFVVYWLQHLAFVGVYKLISNGVRGNTSDFRSWDKVADIYVPNPIKEEQQQIADYLDTKCSEIDSLIADKKRQLDILADYKKSLIYEYVTGKKEVPVNE